MRYGCGSSENPDKFGKSAILEGFSEFSEGKASSLESIKMRPRVRREVSESRQGVSS